MELEKIGCAKLQWILNGKQFLFYKQMQWLKNQSFFYCVSLVMFQVVNLSPQLLLPILVGLPVYIHMT